MASLKQKAAEIIQSEAEWPEKLKALEDWLKCKLASKEASFQRAQELERQGRKMEEEQLNKVRQI